MPGEDPPIGRIVGVEEHAWTPELRDALVRWGGDDTVTMVSGKPETDRLLRDVGEQRLARMDAGGVDVEVLSITTPGTQHLPPEEAVPLARDANDFLADAVRRHPSHFAAFATLPTPDPEAAAAELDRAVTELNLKGALIFPRTGDLYLDHEKFRPIFEVAARRDVPLYLHPMLPPRAVRDASYGGFEDGTGLMLSTGGWGWHVDAGLAALRLILSGTFDRHPGLQLILGHWGEVLVSFADRANVASTTRLERPVFDYITGNVIATAGGIYSHRMLKAALDVLGPDRLMFAADSPYGHEAGAREFVETAPISAEDKAKLAHLNAERFLRLEK